MNNFAGKTCPYCKTEIKPEEEVKVCPACGIPHHLGCWEENKGCTTFGCSEQHYEQQGTNISDVCAKCGAPLGDGQDFCPKCGARKGEPSVNVCGKCGAQLQDGQEFCSKCGQKVGLAVDSIVVSKIGQFNSATNKKNKKKKMAPFIIIGAILAVILVVVLIVLMSPTVEKLTAEGNYEKAYIVASDSEKDTVMQENAVAVVCALSADSLKDRSSFELREAYINEDYSSIVLSVAGKNSYGGIVTNYWYYSYNKEEKTFNLMTTYSTLEEEEEYSFDDAETKLEKSFNNLFLIYVKEIIRSGDELPKDNVKNINHLFTEDLLDGVNLIDAVISVERPDNN